MMKKKIVLPFLLSLLFLCSCMKEEDVEPITIPTEAPSVSVEDSTQTPDVTEQTSAPVVEPVVSEMTKGCFYGENTGTDQTFTGLEPLPLSDFNNPPFENTKNLSGATIEHAYGVAKNEQPHEISVNFQKFFDEKGFDAFCYDSKTQEKILYLTFDCGYENGYTAKILDTLRDKAVKAAFFCTLPEMKQNTEIMTRIINEGHILGNHSVTHPDFSGLTRKQIFEEVKGFDDYLRENFGYSALYFRYPMGKHSENATDMLNAMGYTCIFWSLAYADWDLSSQKGADYALETVVSRIHPGAIILLHAVSPDNANALGRIIDTARAMGYEFRSLSELNR